MGAPTSPQGPIPTNKKIQEKNPEEKIVGKTLTEYRVIPGSRNHGF